MKTPITYHGGKQRMLSHILPMIPKHKIYVEPFVGGAAVFFAKTPVNNEYINDINGNVAAFYRSMKFNFEELNSMIQETLHCEHTYLKAKSIYFSERGIEEVQRAWAFWVNSCLSFASQMGSTFKFVKNKNDNCAVSTNIKNKKKTFFKYQNRLENVVIFNRDALDIIKRLDSKDTFFYLDPPYIGTNQAHYKGYTQCQFDELIKLLGQIEGKFLLSSYPNDSIYKKQFQNKHFEKAFGLPAKGKKTEVLTWNYQLNNEPRNLFNQICTT